MHHVTNFSMHRMFPNFVSPKLDYQQKQKPSDAAQQVRGTPFRAINSLRTSGCI